MDNLDALDDLSAGNPSQPQPDWVEEDIIFHRQQDPFPDHREDEEAITANT